MPSPPSRANCTTTPPCSISRPRADSPFSARAFHGRIAEPRVPRQNRRAKSAHAGSLPSRFGDPATRHKPWKGREPLDRGDSPFRPGHFSILPEHHRKELISRRDMNGTSREGDGENWVDHSPLIRRPRCPRLVNLRNPQDAHAPHSGTRFAIYHIALSVYDPLPHTLVISSSRPPPATNTDIISYSHTRECPTAILPIVHPTTPRTDRPDHRDANRVASQRALWEIDQPHSPQDAADAPRMARLTLIPRLHRLATPRASSTWHRISVAQTRNGPHPTTRPIRRGVTLAMHSRAGRVQST